MKTNYLLILTISFIMYSCKPKLYSLQNEKNVDPINDCPLIKLKATTDYNNSIKQYTDNFKKKSFVIDSLKQGQFLYKTIFDLRESSQFLWLLRVGEKTDSLLLHTINKTKSVESYFNLDDCTIEIIEAEFNLDGSPKWSGSTKVTYY